jgi:replication factor A1
LRYNSSSISKLLNKPCFEKLMVTDYETLIKRIAESCGLTAEEINTRVEAKKARLAGLISKEGAAQIVAAELGISFDKQNVKINEILPGMRRVTIVAKVISLSPIRSYEKNGRSGKVLNITLADETGNTRGVLWDTNHISLFEGGQITNGDVVEISNASLRGTEIHLTAFSDIKKSQSKIENAKTEITNNYNSAAVDKKIIDLKPMDRARMRAVIVQVFEPRTFEVCPECGSRPKPETIGFECEKHGKVTPERRALINAVLDDGTESVRAVFFSDNIIKLGLEKTASDFPEKRMEILGKEAYFTGMVRQNKVFNNTELVINAVEEVDLDKLIIELQQ